MTAGTYKLVVRGTDLPHFKVWHTHYGDAYAEMNAALPKMTPETFQSATIYGPFDRHGEVPGWAKEGVSFSRAGVT